jgi:alkylated DNA repair dioxygenase AlkB
MEMQFLSVILLLPLLVSWTLALQQQQTVKRSDLIRAVPKCFEPVSLLHQVGRQLDRHNDPDGEIGSLVLVRISKQLIAIDNEHYNQPWVEETLPVDSISALRHVIHHTITCCTATSDRTCDILVDATKACGVISRITPEQIGETSRLIENKWDIISRTNNGLERMQAHHLSGIQWAFDCLNVHTSARIPDLIQQRVDREQFPFRIYPAMLNGINTLSIQQLTSDVAFRADYIQTASQMTLPERRLTAWQGDGGVAPFAYSGKAMPRHDWSLTVRQVRDELHQRMHQYYDCCLLNLYPDGDSGMRYHMDPDQGVLWDYDTAVVSVGASRRFSFRPVVSLGEGGGQPHNFVVMHGDVTHMFGNCQTEFQHTVKKAEHKAERAARSSLVFKRTFNYNPLSN